MKKIFNHIEIKFVKMGCQSILTGSTEYISGNKTPGDGSQNGGGASDYARRHFVTEY